MNENKHKIEVQENKQGWVASGSIIEFESSNFKLVQYEVGGASTMDITYKKGEVYRYYGIPPALWLYLQRQADKNSTTIGKELLNEVIRKPDIYPYKRII